eukprot:gene12912-12729_t
MYTAEATSLRASIAKKEREVTKLKEADSKTDSVVKSNAEIYRRRFKEAEKELFKLERALEMKDSQMESFMRVAQ